MLKVIIISVDRKFKIFEKKTFFFENYEFVTFNLTKDPLEIISQIFRINPSIVILDDDFVRPHTIHLLRAIKKVDPELFIIFITSDTSLEFGREINTVGVKYYLMKPVSSYELQEFLISVKLQLNSNT